MNNLLIELEKWNQSYNFDYNCMGCSVFHINQFNMFLQSKNINITNQEIYNNLYKNGTQYNLTNDEKAKLFEETLKISINQIPIQFHNISYGIAYGKNQETLQSENFQKELYKYIKDLTNQMTKHGKFNIDITKLDFDILGKSFLLLTDLKYNGNITFEDYLNAISNNTYQNLSIITKLNNNCLKNPLIYKFGLKLNVMIKQHGTNTETQLFMEELTSFWNTNKKNKLVA